MRKSRDDHVQPGRGVSFTDTQYIAKYKANTGTEPADAAPTPPGPAKPRRTRKPTK